MTTLAARLEIRTRRWLTAGILTTTVVSAWAMAVEADMNLQITSPAFSPGGEIPARFTCQGDDMSPPLRWRGMPAETKTLALVADDPDAPDPAAPKVTWVHWVLYDIPATSEGLPENVGHRLPEGTREGLNDWKRPGYGGPCPPIGRHRYFFKLYALDTELGDLGELSKAALESAMEGHVLARAEVVGTYQKTR